MWCLWKLPEHLSLVYVWKHAGRDEVISMYKTKSVKDKEEVGDDLIHEHMRFINNAHLCRSCHGTFGVYNKKNDNNLPDCLKKSSLMFVADLIKKVQVYELLKKKHEHGAAARLMRDVK